MKPLRIGEVAKQAQVGVETIRFYERQGLLDQPQRRASGYREYEASTVARLHFIRQAKALGFRLSEVQDLLDLWFQPGTNCCAVREKAELKIAELEERIQSLQAMQRSLRKLIVDCRKRGTLADCPLLDGLAPSIKQPSNSHRGAR